MSIRQRKRNSRAVASNSELYEGGGEIELASPDDIASPVPEEDAGDEKKKRLDIE